MYNDLDKKGASCTRVDTVISEGRVRVTCVIILPPPVEKRPEHLCRVVWIRRIRLSRSLLHQPLDQLRLRLLHLYSAGLGVSG